MQTTNLTEPVKQTASYLQLAPILEAIRANNDRRPSNSLPIDTQGTSQQNAEAVPPVTLYNAHGVLSKTNPNSLLGYA
jgi:hypothetical protein